jgi:transposase
MMRLSAVSSGDQMKILSETCLAKNEPEKLRIIDKIEQTSFRALAKEFSDKSGREIDTDYVTSLMEEYAAKKGVSTAQIRGQAYGATRIDLRNEVELFKVAAAASASDADTSADTAAVSETNAEAWNTQAQGYATDAAGSASAADASALAAAASAEAAEAPELICDTMAATLVVGDTITITPERRGRHHHDLRLRLGRGRPLTRPTAVLGEKAYSSRAIRAELRSRQIKAVIPQPSDQIGHRKRRGAKGGRPPAFDATAYKGRNIIERSFNAHQQWRGIATRYDKLAAVYRGAVVLRAITIWLST